MIKVEYIDVWGFEHAIRGMRNPLESHSRSDSEYGCGVGLCSKCNDKFRCDSEGVNYVLGKNDLALMQALYKAGTEHRKYLRQISVSMDIVAPLYWWKELDTYKVGVTSNSCSTMHKIHSKEFGLDDFGHERLLEPSLDRLKTTIDILNQWRDCYINYEEYRDDYLTENPEGQFPERKAFWWQMIQLLPSSYNQRRTIQMNYENVMNIINQRENHKLDEWRELVKILRSLPYVMDIRGELARRRNCE